MSKSSLSFSVTIADSLSLSTRTHYRTQDEIARQERLTRRQGRRLDARDKRMERQLGKPFDAESEFQGNAGRSKRREERLVDVAPGYAGVDADQHHGASVAPVGGGVALLADLRDRRLRGPVELELEGPHELRRLDERIELGRGDPDGVLNYLNGMNVPATRRRPRRPRGDASSSRS